MAAKKFFQGPFEIVECDTFKSLSQTLKSNQADFAVMAIENTLAGSLLPNYSLIRKFGFYIIGEVYLHIKMNLMVSPGTPLTDIRYILSHPVALAQCENYLDSLPQRPELKEYHDTAAAAKWVSENQSKDTAAIANLLSAQLYGLEVLAENIETHKQNFTRFLVLSANETIVPGADKASLSLELPHEPGSLSKVLQVFREENVNLTKIQSVPVIGKPYQYAFKIDVQWEDYKDYQKALGVIKNYASDLIIHGEYKGINYQA